MDDCLVVGGGVVGLSLADELASHGLQVSVVERDRVGREASWAGAGILPPFASQPGSHPLEQLQHLSCRLHEQWAERLKEETGIDNGYRRCGGIHVARSVGEAAVVAAGMKVLPLEGIRVEQLSLGDVPSLEPGLKSAVEAGTIHAAFHLPDEAQIRNPWHLRALAQACTKRKVRLLEQHEVVQLKRDHGRISEVVTNQGSLQADRVCLTGGAWTAQLLNQLGIDNGIIPVRGQMILFRARQNLFRHILNEGTRYLVPREDGHVLVGSSEEEVGFEKGTTPEVLSDLTNLAYDLVPELREAEIERTWSGLRPGSFDGLPYIGLLPELQNAYVAAGHFRSGLFLAPATAFALSQWMLGAESSIDLSPFRVIRGLT